MRPIHWAAVVAGLAAVAVGLRLAFSDGVQHVDDGSYVGAAAIDGDAGEVPARSQVQLLGGPPTRKAAEEPLMGELRSAADVEAERRKEQLLEVMKNLDGAPIYVEGVDGPSEPDPFAPPVTPTRR